MVLLSMIYRHLCCNNAEDNFCMSISESTNVTFSLTAANENFMLIKHFLIGDIKALFQLAGRNGHESKHFLFCKCRQTVWKKSNELSDDLANDEKWTIHS